MPRFAGVVGLIAALVGGATLPASAHVAWFVTPGEALACPCHLPMWMRVGCLALAAVAIVAGYLRLGRRRPLLAPSGVANWTDGLIRLTLGISLAGGAWEGYLMSPDCTPPAGWQATVAGLLQAATAFIVVLPLITRKRVPEWPPLLALFLWNAVSAPSLFCSLENLHVVGFALWFHLRARSRDEALSVLRCVVGVSLLLLGLNEKLIHPEMSLAFLARHPWNFAASFGISNLMFVLAAGIAEVVLGAWLALDVLTVPICLAVIALMSTTMALMGTSELLGHLPLLAFCVVAIRGSADGTRPR